MLFRSLSVLNVAVAGHSPIHYALYMPRFQAAFHPALAIVQIDDGDLNEMEDARANAETMDEFYARGSAAAAERATSGPVGFVRGIFRRSALLTELRSRVQQLTKQERARLGQKLGLLHPDLTDVVALPATPRAEAMLDSLIGEVERVNPHTILVYVPHIRYFGPVPHVAYPVRRAWYHALAARRGLPIVDPTDAMLAEFARTHEPLQGFLNARPGEGHMNARGHRLLGELLAETIRRQTAPDGPWSEVRIAPVASTRGAATGAARTAIAPGARP